MGRTKKIGIDVLYHRFGNSIPGHTTKVPPPVVVIVIANDGPTFVASASVERGQESHCYCAASTIVEIDLEIEWHTDTLVCAF